LVDKKKIKVTEIVDPDKRVWEYDGDGTKIYKLDQGYRRKTLYTKEHYWGTHWWRGRGF
tara:strand:- start:1219 stop:1395 length:177 start_codon:yes stop_codon:yes gene_type:complete